jgi:hypothetical protein
MKRLLPIAAAITLAASTAAWSQSVRTDADVRAKTPGHQMQLKGSVKGSPGASAYAPGHRMQLKGSVKGTTGASGYAPGQIKHDSDLRVNAPRR